MLEYLPILRSEFPKKHDLELEQMCVRDPGLQALTGHTEHEHRMAAMKLLFPRRTVHEWRERAVEGYYRVKLEHRKELLYIGSSNSNKTGTLADLVLEVWWENPESTSVYITSPYEDATETGIWARIQEQFDAATAVHPWLPGKVKPSENAIVMYDRNPLSFIRVVTVDQVGKLVGKKSSDFGTGMMLVVCDELPEFKRSGDALLGVMKNLRSVPNFMLIGAGNFADVNDALGQLAEPAEEGGYEVLNVDESHEWETRRGGLCLRFDGHQSPNVKAGRDIYPFVTTMEYLADLAKIENGTRTPGYYRYARSFPMLDFNEFTVTNAVKIRAGGCYEKVEWSTEPQMIGAHCDPGFGGDPCVMSFWKVGWAFEAGERLQVFELSEAMITIPLEVGMKDAAGDDVTVDQQIAERCKTELDLRKIAYSHFSFDDSLRGGIVQAMMRIIGVNVVAISSGGPATKRVLSAVRQVVDAGEKIPVKQKLKTAKDEYVNFSAEMHFALTAGVAARQIRGLQLSREAVQQLCTRRWRWSGKRREIEPKISSEQGARARGWGYKLHSGGKSPNESDSLVGGLENARRLGFRLASVALTTGGSVDLLNQWLRQEDARAIRASFEGHALPPGRLHSMESETSLHSGRLNS